jgi:hypothetical protein
MRLIVSAVAAISSLIAFSAMIDAPVAQAAVHTFEVQLGGAQENPPVTNYPGTAFARFTFDDQTRALTYFITVSGVSPNIVTAAHIHRGAVGVNGPIVHFFSATGFTQEVEGTIMLSAADEADLRAGNFYANVHSVDHPGGFARGQMILPASAAPAATPAAVTPPRTGEAGLVEGGRDLTGLIIGGSLIAFVGAFYIARRLVTPRR